MMNKIFISRSIYKSDHLEISSFLIDPVIVANENRYTIREYCAISLSNPQNKFAKGANFTVSMDIYHKFMNKLEMVIHWFYDPGKNDLFCMDDNNSPHFNLKYRDLRAVIKNRENNNQMEIMPSEVEVSDKIYEGISMAINFVDNITFIPLYELENIFNILKGFSFQNEEILLTQMYTMGLLTKRVMNPADYSAHLRFSSYGNINTANASNNPFGGR